MKSRRFKSIWSEGFAEYFWSLVIPCPASGCWNWSKSTNKDGYGQLKAGGRMWVASRLAITLHLGYEIDGKLACHHCDNPRCCNPSHIYAGTKADNARDKATRGRENARQGSENHFAKLTEAEVEEIKRLALDGVGNAEIAARFGIHHSTVWLIKTGRTWRSNAA